VTAFAEHQWAHPRPTGGAASPWYYQGRGALAHADWSTAAAALRNVVEQRDAGDDRSLLWLCRIGLATLAWRAEDGAAALEHAREAHALADRIAAPWSQIWSLWLLGHVYAGLHRRAEAAACFAGIRELIADADDQQRMIGHLAAVATMQCTVESAPAPVLAERIFALAQLAARIARRQGLPFEAVDGLERAPVLIHPAAAAGAVRQRLEWLGATPPLPEATPLAGAAAPDPEAVPAVLPPAESEDAAPDLRACCLGRFEVWVGAVPVTQWAGSKGKTLLKLLLAAYPSLVPAPQLMQALWDGVEEELARQRLHTAISDLRRSLRSVQPEAGGLIIAQNGCYGLDPQATIWIDSVAFSCARRVGLHYEQTGRIAEAQTALREAVALYRGEFLADDRYEEWPIAQRERLKHEYLGMLAQLCRWAFDAEDYPACINWARLVIAADPCREDAHALLMHCYSRLGRRTMALRQYRQCVEALRRELDAVPAPETEALHRRLQQGFAI
jgi:DNA-binding SARP family transcriptional activator